jgi:hypothetical protein
VHLETHAYSAVRDVRSNERTTFAAQQISSFRSDHSRMTEVSCREAGRLSNFSNCVTIFNPRQHFDTFVRRRDFKSTVMDVSTMRRRPRKQILEFRAAYCEMKIKIKYLLGKGPIMTTNLPKFNEVQCKKNYGSQTTFSSVFCAGIESTFMAYKLWTPRDSYCCEGRSDNVRSIRFRVLTQTIAE